MQLGRNLLSISDDWVNPIIASNCVENSLKQYSLKFCSVIELTSFRLIPEFEETGKFNGDYQFVLSVEVPEIIDETN